MDIPTLREVVAAVIPMPVQFISGFLGNQINPLHNLIGGHDIPEELELKQRFSLCLARTRRDAV
jgi:hypothetical protein